MRSDFRKEKNTRQAGAASLAVQIASSLAMVSLCYAATPVFADAGNSLLASACDFMQGDADMQKTVNLGQVSYERSCQERSIARPSSAFTVAAKPRLIHAVQTPGAAEAEAADLATTVSFSTPDRHWCVAEAFNAALDHKKLDFPSQQQAPALVLK